MKEVGKERVVKKISLYEYTKKLPTILKAVSYTHLDVYKRQVQKDERLFCAPSDGLGCLRPSG